MRYTEEEENLIIISGIEEVTPPERLKIAYDGNAVKNLPERVYNMVRDKLRDKEYRAELFENLDKKGIICVTILSQDYPEILKNIDEPPIVLYCKGNIGLLKTKCFSVVGSRSSTNATIAQCRKISEELTHAFTVVTGMAEGADSAAVEGALPSGKIISVLANGFDYFYPAVNRGLIERVGKNGLLISEYPPDIPPRRFNFPYRNRIIAGLSRGTLVASAGKRSGALITADYAADYGRDVFAFPYNAGVTSGAGCNNLIKNGAYLTENILDIFEVYGLDLKKSEKSVTLSDLERAVLEQIKITGEGFLPVIAQNLKKQTYQLLPAISMLEIKKLITPLGGNRYGIV